MNVITPNPLPPPIDKYEGQPLERIFNHGVVGAFGGVPSPEDGEDDSPYAYTVRMLIDDSQSFEDSTLAPDREENLRYFYAEEPPIEGEGTSSVVSTDFRDTVMAIL